jgi:hypothetical protein
MVLLAEAEGAAAPEGAAPLAVVVVVCVVVAAPEAGAAAEAPVLPLQESETGFISETLNLLSEPIEPVAEICFPTCESRPLPSSLYAVPFWSVKTKSFPDLLTQPLMVV